MTQHQANIEAKCDEYRETLSLIAYNDISATQAKKWALYILAKWQNIADIEGD